MKRWIISAAAILSAAVSCEKLASAPPGCMDVEVRIREKGVKSALASEEVLSDVNIFVTGEKGVSEGHIFRKLGEGTDKISLKLMEGRPYDIYAFTNAGYDLGAMDRKALENMRWYLRYPDNFDHGIPGSCMVEGFVPAPEEPLNLEVTRLLSRISVSLDRSALDEDIDFFLKEARIGNCARSADVFHPSGARDKNDIFPSGYYCSTSDSFDLYTLENCQEEKNEELSSYVEMEIDYMSPTLYSKGENGLIYRFYIRENDSYDVERGCHYHITVRPHGDGLLCEDSWRVDKSSLVEYDGEPYLRFSPSGTTVDGKFYANYYRMNILDSMKLSISRFPSSMKISLDKDMVREEEADGRALYTLDKACRTLTVRSLGRVCQSSMSILVESPYENLEDLVVIDVEDRGSSQ